MPEMRAHRGAAKRVEGTASGQLERSRAFTSHLLTNKNTKQKRQSRKVRLVSESDMERAKQLLTYRRQKQIQRSVGIA